MTVPKTGQFVPRQICIARWDIGRETLRRNPALQEIVVDEHRVWNSNFHWIFKITRDCSQKKLRFQTFLNGMLCDEEAQEE